MKNVMSIDVEDWFCVYNLSRLIRYEDWDACESRVERSTLRLLELFRQHQVEATFFVLGWVADRFPDLVREIERDGHEIASHGYSHRLLTFMTAGGVPGRPAAVARGPGEDDSAGRCADSARRRSR